MRASILRQTVLLPLLLCPLLFVAPIAAEDFAVFSLEGTVTLKFRELSENPSLRSSCVDSAILDVMFVIEVEGIGPTPDAIGVMCFPRWNEGLGETDWDLACDCDAAAIGDRVRIHGLLRGWGTEADAQQRQAMTVLGLDAVLWLNADSLLVLP